jgi:hypothetical protein
MRNDDNMVKYNWTSDIGHRTSDIGHRTSDIGHRTSDILLIF